MTKRHSRRSGRAIVIHEERIALLQRDRGGQTYYVFPGGGIEGNETPEEAAVRAVYEELGIVVRPEELAVRIAARTLLSQVAPPPSRSRRHDK
jgi:8-oxo-dGTP diphosphatase